MVADPSDHGPSDQCLFFHFTSLPLWSLIRVERSRPMDGIRTNLCRLPLLRGLSRADHGSLRGWILLRRCVWQRFRRWYRSRYFRVDRAGGLQQGLCLARSDCWDPYKHQPIPDPDRRVDHPSGGEHWHQNTSLRQSAATLSRLHCNERSHVRDYQRRS